MNYHRAIVILPMYLTLVTMLIDIRVFYYYLSASLRKLEDLFSSFLFTVVENFSLPVDTFFAIT